MKRGVKIGREREGRLRDFHGREKKENICEL